MAGTYITIKLSRDAQERQRELMSGNRNTKYKQGDSVLYEGKECEVKSTGPNTVGILVDGAIKWVHNDDVTKFVGNVA